MIMNGSDGTVIKVVSKVSPRGLAKVVVMEVGSLLLLRKGEEIPHFKVKDGVIKFTK